MILKGPCMKDFLTDENFKHKIDFDNQLLPYKIYETHIINRLPDTLFIGILRSKFPISLKELHNIILITIILTARVATLS